MNQQQETNNSRKDNSEMNLRDYFAGQALSKIADIMGKPELIAHYAYSFADAMIKTKNLYEE